MIKVSFIAPTKLIPKYGNKGSFHLALSHLIDLDWENEYEKELRASGLPIYLDNGLFENKKPESLETLLLKAVKLNAKYVFAPDTLYDTERTEKMIGEAWSLLQKRNYEFKTKVELAVVVQADNAKDYIESWQRIDKMPEVSLIGLSILAIPKSFAEVCGTSDITKTRIEFLSRLKKSYFPQTPIHLLGAGSSYADVEFARKHCPWVESHDSSSAVWNGIQKKQINPTTLEVEGGKTSIPVDFCHDQPLTNEQDEIIKKNISVVLGVTH